MGNGVTEVWVATYTDIGGFSVVTGVAATATGAQVIAAQHLVETAITATTWAEEQPGRLWRMWIDEHTVVDVERFEVQP